MNLDFGVLKIEHRHPKPDTSSFKSDNIVKPKIAQNIASERLMFLAITTLFFTVFVLGNGLVQVVT